jgi:5-bromo-4-chloroindolyl phosphate hydrolysis protein
MAKSRAKRYNPKIDMNNPLSFKRGKLFYLFLIPIAIAVVLSLIKQKIGYFILDIIGFGLFYLTAKANSIGLEQEFEYYTKTLAKAPKIPYKTIAGVLLGVSTFYIASFAGGINLFKGLFLGIIATVGYFLYYGFDPRKDKLANLGDISPEFVLETLKISRDKLKSIEEDMEKIENSKLNRKLRVAVDKAYEILDNIEQDPKDLRVARKFIIVYLDGIKEVTKSYVELDEKDITEDTKERLYALLSDVENRFAKELEKLKRNDQFELDVNIDALKEQIKN